VKIAALLPHVEVFGGVRRYLELGNEFVRRGHAFTLFHPDGGRPAWFDFRGEIRPFSRLAEESFDIGLCSEYSVLSRFAELQARMKYFYFVLEGHKEEKAVASRTDLLFLGNSEGICRRMERKYGIVCRRAPGGVNLDVFHPLPEKPAHEGLTILCYGRIGKRRKGVPQAIRAVERIRREFPGVRLILFDALVGRDRRDPRPLIRSRVPFEFHLDLPQDKMAGLFAQADIFLMAERRAGWSNTSAEAMACRLPVVCTPSGTRDFAFAGRTALVAPWPLPFLLARRLRNLARDPELRERLAEAGHRKILEFAWPALAGRLLGIFEESPATPKLK
jgi:glycosyltransferase involved in cell wall biosynthesis